MWAMMIRSFGHARAMSSSRIGLAYYVFGVLRIVFIKAIIDRLVKNFGLVLRGVVVLSCARGVRHSVQRWPGRIQGSWMEGAYRVGE